MRAFDKRKNTQRRIGQPQPPVRRGAAEIELLVVITFLFIPILFILGRLLPLGTARISFVFQNEQDAYQDATTTSNPKWAQPSGDTMLFDSGGEMDNLQLIANRLHVADATSVVTSQTWELHIPSVTLSSQTDPNMAEFISPAWAYSSWPVASDGTQIDDLIQAYADESVNDVSDPLELASPSPP